MKCFQRRPIAQWPMNQVPSERRASWTSLLPLDTERHDRCNSSYMNAVMWSTVFQCAGLAISTLPHFAFLRYPPPSRPIRCDRRAAYSSNSQSFMFAFLANCPNDHPQMHTFRVDHLRELIDSCNLVLWCGTCGTSWSASDELLEKVKRSLDKER